MSENAVRKSAHQKRRYGCYRTDVLCWHISNS